jgi:hypothetical protein
MGWGYVLFRLGYALRQKTGVLRRQFPTNPPQRNFISLEGWKNLPVKFFFDDPKSIPVTRQPNEHLKQRYLDFLDGKLWYFNATQIEIGRDYDWLTNPLTQYRYDIGQHWSQVEDLSEQAGDIKYVWEKSRFSYILDVVRYDYHFQQDCGELVFAEIDHWMQQNPINQGPNYKCSQEISLRTLNWLFVLYYYRDNKALTDERFQRMMHCIYWQMRHVYHNINFSRKTVRNNHAITECLMLYLGGLFFPFFPEAQRWKTQGKRWFEEEIAYQIYEDGTFLQFSHNYHRVVVQLLTHAFYLSEANKEQFDAVVYERAIQSLDYLFQCQAGKNGALPVYGANDGALFFKFNDADYQDFRPQLNALYYYFSGKVLYQTPTALEDHHWYSGNLSAQRPRPDWLLVKKSVSSYPNGGIYLFNDGNTFTFIKCAGYKDRPSHADNLHIDVWVDGENVLCDSGTYKYNTNREEVQYFTGSTGHNAITLGIYETMQKGPRFIWLFWNKLIQAGTRETEDYLEFRGTIRAFGQLNAGITATRVVRKQKGALIWVIEDHVSGNVPTDLPLVQMWHIHPNVPTVPRFTAYTNRETALEAQSLNSWYSNYYGLKTSNPGLRFETNQRGITTTIQL